MLMNDKIMFDRYYCINSTKLQKMKKIFAHYIVKLGAVLTDQGVQRSVSGTKVSNQRLKKGGLQQKMTFDTMIEMSY